MTVTIKDIAERAGVSFSTVSKALRNSPLVQEKTKRNILAIAEELGYVPNMAARTLVSNKSGAFGVIWPSVERATPSLMITLVNEILEDRGYTTLLSINRADAAIEAFHRFQVDAILLFDDRVHSTHRPPRREGTIPLLYYGIGGSSAYPTIDVQRWKSIELAVVHLTGLGHTKIAYIGEPPYVDVFQTEKIGSFTTLQQRYSFTGQVMPVAGMETHDGYEAAKQLLASADRPTAIVSGSYDLSRGILRAAHERGVRVPDDLSVGSYDHIPQAAVYDIPLTVVGVEVSAIARQIADSLIALADKQPHPPCIELEPELVVRSSSLVLP